jgi:hypothetical protein
MGKSVARDTSPAKWKFFDGKVRGSALPGMGRPPGRTGGFRGERSRITGLRPQQPRDEVHSMELPARPSCGTNPSPQTHRLKSGLLTESAKVIIAA